MEIKLTTNLRQPDRQARICHAPANLDEKTNWILISRLLKEVEKYETLFDGKSKTSTWIFIVVQDMRGFSMIVSSHLTKMICNVKGDRVVACVFIILWTNTRQLWSEESTYVFLTTPFNFEIKEPSSFHWADHRVICVSHYSI